MTVYVLIREDQNDHGYVDTTITGIFREERAAREHEAAARALACREGLRVCDEDESDPDWQVSWKIEGVDFDPTTNSDLFFVTLAKTEDHYSPTTMYRDYAVSPDLFHWESQSTTSVQSPTGQRYLNQREKGSHVLLFVRQHKSEAGRTAPYTCLGAADYVSHQGSRPIAITWRLRRPMPADFFRDAKLAVG